MFSLFISQPPPPAYVLLRIAIHLQQLVLQRLKTGLASHQILLNPQVLTQKRIVIKRPLGILLKGLQIDVELLARFPKSLDPVTAIDLQERSALARDRRPSGQHLVMRRRIDDHGGVFAERLFGLLEDGFCEDADVDADVAGGGDHGLTGDGHHPEIDAIAARVREGFDGGEVC